MSKLSITKGQFVEAIEGIGNGDPSKLDAVFSALENAVSKHDYDVGWKPLPEDNIVNHGLGVIPGEILVFAADDIDGAGISPATFSSADTETITVSASKAYVRVYANK